MSYDNVDPSNVALAIVSYNQSIYDPVFYFISKNTKGIMIDNATSIYIVMILNIFNCYVKYSFIYI